MFEKENRDFPVLFWLPLLDSLCCGKATAVATVHRTVAKSRLSGPAGGAADFWPSFLTKKKEELKTQFLLAPPVGLEPTTHGLTVRRSTD